MLPADKGTRDLLPLIQDETEDRILSEVGPIGSPAMDDALPWSVPTSAPHQIADPSLRGKDDAEGRESVPINAPSHPHSAFDVSALARGDTGPDQIATPKLTLDIDAPKSLIAFGNGGGAYSERGHTHVQDGDMRVKDNDDHVRGTSRDPLQGPLDDGDDHVHGASRDPAQPLLDDGDGTGGTIDLDEKVHRITVTQDADVDQDASIIVHGYAGKVVARLQIDQDLLMDQDVDIDFTIDGSGQFSVLVDQDMRIDQNVDIDLKIFDEDGVLYVDLFLRDRVAVEQDTSLDLQIRDGSHGGSVVVDQTLEMNQDVDIDIDIEDDLEERYIVKVDIDVQQDIDADQDATVDITNQDGEIDMDVDAFQTAFVDQEAIARIDFTSL